MDETIKRGKFSGLLYRELYLARKKFVIGIVMFAAIAIFCILVMLSFEYGNIAKLLDFVIGDPAGEEARALAEVNMSSMRESIFFMMKLLPVIMSCDFQLAISEATGRDELVSWQRFIKCTPISPAKRAAVKVVLNAATCCVSFILATVYMCIVSAVQGAALGYHEFSLAICAVSAFAVFSSVGQIYITIFHSTDKGYLALLATITIPIWAAAFSNLGGHNDAETDIGIDDIVSFCEGLTPFIPLILIGVSAVSFAALLLLYKRRER